MQFDAMMKLALLRAATSKRMVERAQAGKLADPCEETDSEASASVRRTMHSMSDPDRFRETYNAHGFMLMTAELADLIEHIAGGKS